MELEFASRINEGRLTLHVVSQWLVFVVRGQQWRSHAQL